MTLLSLCAVFGWDDERADETEQDEGAADATRAEPWARVSSEARPSQRSVDLPSPDEVRTGTGHGPSDD